MSFSVGYIGKPEAIKRKLAEESNRLTGQSKEEFDAVRPALETILDQNVNNGVLNFRADGHASIDRGPVGEPYPEPKKTYGSCSVSISVLGQLAE